MNKNKKMVGVCVAQDVVGSYAPISSQKTPLNF